MNMKTKRFLLSLATIMLLSVFTSCASSKKARIYPTHIKYEKSYNYSRAKIKTVKPLSPKESNAFNNFRVKRSNKEYMGQKTSARKSRSSNICVRYRTLGQDY